MDFIADNIFFIVFFIFFAYRIWKSLSKKESVFQAPTMRGKLSYLIAGFIGFLFGLFILHDIRYIILFIIFTAAATYDIATQK